ncbi:MAG: hypothetical protein A2233_01005 [Candidatus Kerfeldbacteria bacterium RIFOXYA2_FULL_38_24]|uniref:Glycosyl transferase family 1 domain-containing protein n=1 Tax=Candidatus Kerfeldbacteria bacterium RIFOXYB2_FULL_38_14 TaxID=1798547 RepID=A0A1G2BBW7_9BACT|nr:MAG: hypothetical protein A2233_01005 [Candidatus Kerfeldbacteria bacterium RIFOXYA2_FULL_38_24]OGY86515.1 MAG: hypothetical protein A2319_01995 [Candidatus Kerfeldbacteria bacterium RIFOXYB2_FULL_38_14]
MKILQINKFFYRRAGAENYFLELSRALEELGQKVMYFSMKHPQNLKTPYEKYFIENIDFGNGAKKSLKKAEHFVYSTEAVKNLNRLLKNEKPDIAHLHNITHHLTPAILDVLRYHKIPTVQTLHDLQVMCPNYKMFIMDQPCERCKKHKYWNCFFYNCVQDSRAASLLSAFEMTFHNVLLKTYARGISRFIAPSHFMQKKMIEWGWPEEKISYLPNFVERKRDSTIARKNQIAFVGRFTKDKGVYLLLEAVKKLPHIRFVFAGSGEEEKQMQDIITKQHLNNCQLLGFLDEQKISTLIQSSTAVAVPSLLWENASLTVLESLSLGTPVIASNHGGLPELVQNGENGYLFTPASVDELVLAIEKVFKNSPLQIPENQYTKASHLTRLLKLYEEVVAKK